MLNEGYAGLQGPAAGRLPSGNGAGAEPRKARFICDVRFLKRTVGERCRAVLSGKKSEVQLSDDVFQSVCALFEGNDFGVGEGSHHAVFDSVSTHFREDAQTHVADSILALKH